MPKKGTNTAQLARRMVDILKAARLEWITAAQAAEIAGYAKPDYVRNVLLTMRDMGIVDEKWSDQQGRPGARAKLYRVAEAWRNV